MTHEAAGAPPTTTTGVAVLADIAAATATRSLWGDALHRLTRNRLAILGAAVIAVMAVAAVFAPLVSPYPYQQIFPGKIIADPTLAHPFGTTLAGQDTLARIIYGARNSLAVGVFVQFIILVIGVAVGGGAAFGGKRLDGLLMRFTDIVYAFPDLLFVIMLQQVLSGTRLGGYMGGLFVVFLAIGFVGWVNLARLVRGQMLSLRERDFVIAAEALGASRIRIFLRHLLPNTLSPVIVALTFGVPSAIFTEATLSFIGIGVRPPLADWGNMIYDGYGAVLATPWPIFFPALALAITFMSFQFLGDGLRDALDPRTR
ncbi:MAG TPA: ABC transporter permease [Dehalococcoidia bacterium]|nr:ABC transporter permease [Dehalococcoidia bacterium]